MKREVWADNVKAIACILVVMGHFLQSMNRSNVIGDSQIYGLLVKTIYYFHVPCFFLISGYFHQTNPKYSTITEYSKYIFEKLINLGIPYLVFSSITYVLKIIFEDAVNVSNNKSLLYNLLLEPISPYWFLYILFLCYLFIPIMKQTNKMYLLIAIMLLLKVLSFSNIILLPTPVSLFMSSGIYFVLGMTLSEIKIKKIEKSKKALLTFLFIPISIISFYYPMNGILEFLISILGVLLVLTVSTKYDCSFSTDFSNYFMYIYLLHTIFSAGLRTILFKMGIYSFPMHILMGVIGGIMIPILIARLANHCILLKFLFLPTKAIKEYKSKNKRYP